MRRFTDATGAAWDVVVGKASWGTLVAVFVPAASGPQIREAVLHASTQLEAEEEIDRMDDVALGQLLERATIKEQ